MACSLQRKLLHDASHATAASLDCTAFETRLLSLTRRKEGGKRSMLPPTQQDRVQRHCFHALWQRVRINHLSQAPNMTGYLIRWHWLIWFRLKWDPRGRSTNADAGWERDGSRAERFWGKGGEANVLTARDGGRKHHQLLIGINCEERQI